jgi:hypothetical protein
MLIDNISKINYLKSIIFLTKRKWWIPLEKGKQINATYGRREVCWLRHGVLVIQYTLKHHG